MKKTSIYLILLISYFYFNTVVNSDNNIWSNHYGGNPNGSNEIESDYNLINARIDWESELSGYSIISLTTTSKEVICVTRDTEEGKTGKLFSFSLNDGKLKWKWKMNKLSTVSTTNDMLILGQDYNKLICFNSSDGRLNWEYTVDNNSNISDYQIYNPIISLERVYFASTNGKLYCFDFKSKTIIWSSNLYLYGFLLYEEKLVSYYGKKATITDAKTGKLINEFQLDKMPDKMATIGKGKFIYWTDDIIYCHDLLNGKVLWKKEFLNENPKQENCNISISNNDRVLLGTYFGLQPLICLDINNGNELWRAGERKFTGGICSYPTIVRDIVYIAYDFEYIGIFYLDDGKEVFKKELYDAIQDSEYLPVIGNRIIFNNRGDFDKRKLVLQCYRNIASKLIFAIDSDKMIYDNETKTIDATPKIIKGVTYIPARYIVDSFGGKVGFRIDEGGYIAYDPKKGFYIVNEPQRKIVEAELGKNTLELVINSNTAILNDKEVIIDQKDLKITPIIINGRTMVPLRFLAESLGCKVEWKPDTKEIIVTYQP